MNSVPTPFPAESSVNEELGAFGIHPDFIGITQTIGNDSGAFIVDQDDKTIVTMLSATVLVTLFGTGFDDLFQLSLICAAVGFFTNSGVVGLYAILAKVYSASTRATGSGFAIGMGRGGSVLAPILAGFLFAAGQGLQTVSIVMALGSTFAAILLWRLMRSRTNEVAPAQIRT